MKATKTPAKIIAELAVRKPTSVCKTPPSGSLVAEKLQTGEVKLTWRYTHDKATYEEYLGLFDPAASSKSTQPTEIGLSITAAIFAAQRLAVEHRTSVDAGGLPYHELKQAKLRQAAKEAEEAQAAIKQTTRQFLDTYQKLKAEQNHKTGQDIKSIFRGVPDWIAVKHPAEVTIDDWHPILVAKAVNTPVAGDRLRSYLSAAYNLAIRATTERRIDDKSTDLMEMAAFNIVDNPIKNVAPHAAAKNANPNGLSTAEMITYWECIQSLRGIEGAALRIHLLTGGLRPTQLVRLAAENVDLGQNGNGSFTLIEIKGSGGPKRYTTPIRTYMAKDFGLLLLANQGGKKHVFSTDGGTTQIDRATMGDWAAKAVGDKIESFTLGRVRSGVTDLMSASGLVLDVVCDAVQSHGQKKGVVDRHYRTDAKLEPKRRALGVLYKVLTGVMVINTAANDDDLAADFKYDVM